jgi:hypothetical protein
MAALTGAVAHRRAGEHGRVTGRACRLHRTSVRFVAALAGAVPGVHAGARIGVAGRAGARLTRGVVRQPRVALAAVSVGVAGAERPRVPDRRRMAALAGSEVGRGPREAVRHVAFPAGDPRRVQAAITARPRVALGARHARARGVDRSV